MQQQQQQQQQQAPHPHQNQHAQLINRIISSAYNNQHDNGSFDSSILLNGQQKVTTKLLKKNEIRFL